MSEMSDYPTRMDVHVHPAGSPDGPLMVGVQVNGSNCYPLSPSQARALASELQAWATAAEQSSLLTQAAGYREDYTHCSVCAQMLRSEYSSPERPRRWVGHEKNCPRRGLTPNARKVAGQETAR